MKTKAVYAGSFDPITNGHLSVIKRAAALFDLYVIVAQNPDKKTLFTLEERIDMVKWEVWTQHPTCPAPINVYGTNGLVGEVAKALRAQVFIRGLRSEDALPEINLANLNKKYFPNLTTLLLPCEAETANYSSSLAKSKVLLGLQGSESAMEESRQYVSPKIHRLLVARLGKSDGGA